MIMVTAQTDTLQGTITYLMAAVEQTVGYRTLPQLKTGNRAAATCNRLCPQPKTKYDVLSV